MVNYLDWRSSALAPDAAATRGSWKGGDDTTGSGAVNHKNMPSQVSSAEFVHVYARPEQREHREVESRGRAGSTQLTRRRREVDCWCDCGAVAR